MKRLELLIKKKPELKPEIYNMKLFLKIISNPKWAGVVLEDNDTLQFYLEYFGDELVAQGFMTERELNQLPVGKMRHSDLDRGKLKILVKAAEHFGKQLTTSPTLAPIQSPAEANVQKFCQLFELDESEQAVLSLLVTIGNSEILDDAHRRIKFYNFDHICIFFAHLVDMPAKAVAEVLGSQSKLRRLGILNISGKIESRHGFLDQLKLIDVLSEVLCNEVFDEDTMLRTLVSPVADTTLEVEDFAHIKDHIDHLDRLITDARQPHAILIYGPPGTGKTELAELMAGRHRLRALAVPAVDDDKSSIFPIRRVDTFNLAQNLLSLRKQPALLVFDEVEDVFNRRPEERQTSKAWFNQLLENIKVDTIWLANSANIDPAYLRRFSYVFELKHPDQKTKKALLKKYHPNLKLRKVFVDELTSFVDISIAAIRQACAYAEQTGINSRAAEKFIASSVAGKFEAHHWERIEFKCLQAGHRKQDVPYPFNPEFVNTNEPIETVVQGLKRTGEGRLILFGPPGTGKTSFVHYVANQLNKALLQKDAASLMNCFVGETEKNIHRAFAEARQSRAILFLDEADSFLTDRLGHSQTWQTSEVNQLLQEMEKFPGILIMSTNLIEKLDPAAARRFDYKIRFDYLDLNQRFAFFQDWMSQNGATESFDAQKIKTRLQSLNRIVPGYFKLLARKSRITGQPFNAEQLLEGLRQEMLMNSKEIAKPIGFIQ